MNAIKRINALCAMSLLKTSPMLRVRLTQTQLTQEQMAEEIFRN